MKNRKRRRRIVIIARFSRMLYVECIDYELDFSKFHRLSENLAEKQNEGVSIER